MDDHAAIVSMLTGPTSSLALLLIMLYGVWTVTTQTLLPKMSAWVDKHLAHLKEAGRTVIEIERGKLGENAEATRAALATGPDVVF